MRLRLIIAIVSIFAALWGTALIANAQATNFLANVGCDAVNVSGTAGVSGSVVINVTAGVVLVTGNTTGVTAGQTFNITAPYSAAQPVGTSITVTTTIGTFTDTRTVSCAGPLGGGGDGRLNGLSDPIAIFCQNGGVNLTNIVNGVGVSSVTASGGQIVNGLVTAGTTGQNTQIVGSGSTSLWALSSGELQAVFRGTTNFDFIFSPSRCGITVTLTGVVVVTRTPVATPIYGPVLPPVTGTVPPTGSTNCVAPTGTRGAYVVRSGDNLFRIGLRFGVDYHIIAAYNNIANPARIFVGQCIIIP
jgi:LysM repeat protein